MKYGRTVTRTKKTKDTEFSKMRSIMRKLDNEVNEQKVNDKKVKANVEK